MATKGMYDSCYRSYPTTFELNFNVAPLYRATTAQYALYKLFYDDDDDDKMRMVAAAATAEKAGDHAEQVGWQRTGEGGASSAYHVYRYEDRQRTAR